MGNDVYRAGVRTIQRKRPELSLHKGRVCVPSWTCDIWKRRLGISWKRGWGPEGGEVIEKSGMGFGIQTRGLVREAYRDLLSMERAVVVYTRKIGTHRKKGDLRLA